jgi:hypothetical protein
MNFEIGIWTFSASPNICVFLFAKWPNDNGEYEDDCKFWETSKIIRYMRQGPNAVSLD